MKCNQNNVLEVSVNDVGGALQVVGDGDDVGQGVRVRRGLNGWINEIHYLSAHSRIVKTCTDM